MGRDPQVDGGGDAGGAGHGDEKMRVGSRAPREIIGAGIIHAELIAMMRSSRQ